MEYGEAINRDAAERAARIATRLRMESDADLHSIALRAVAGAYCVCVTDGEDAAEDRFSPIHARLVEDVERQLLDQRKGEIQMALPHAAPGRKLAIPPLASMPAETKTTALVKTDRFEAVQLVLRSGTTIAPHAVDGYFTLHCLEGAVTVETDSATIPLIGGDWVYLDRGERHALSADEDSSLLLTIMFDKSE